MYGLKPVPFTQARTLHSSPQIQSDAPLQRIALFRLTAEEAAAANLVVAAHNKGKRLGVGDVLLGENALCEGVGVVGVERGNRALEDDDAVVEMLIDKMHRAAGELDAVVEGLGLRIEAGKGGQQRGMNIENALGKSSDELGREQTHITGETDEVDVVCLEAGDHVGIVLGAGAAFGDERGVRQAEIFGGMESGRIGDVGEDDGDLDAGQTAGADGVGDGEEVGATAGEQNSQSEGPTASGHGLRDLIGSRQRIEPQGLKNPTND